jgi:hypothetical protein
MDVVYALKRQGRTIYGFGGWLIWISYMPAFLNSLVFKNYYIENKMK